MKFTGAFQVDLNMHRAAVGSCRLQCSSAAPEVHWPHALEHSVALRVKTMTGFRHPSKAIEAHLYKCLVPQQPTWNTCHMPSHGENFTHGKPAAVSFLCSMVDADSRVSLSPTWMSTEGNGPFLKMLLPQSALRGETNGSLSLEASPPT